MLEDVIDEKLGQKSPIKNQVSDEKPILKSATRNDAEDKNRG